MYEFMLAVTITLAHTTLRHSSFLNSASDTWSGQMRVPAHAGAMSRMDGQ